MILSFITLTKIFRFCCISRYFQSIFHSVIYIDMGRCNFPVIPDTWINTYGVREKW